MGFAYGKREILNVELRLKLGQLGIEDDRQVSGSASCAGTVKPAQERSAVKLKNRAFMEPLPLFYPSEKGRPDQVGFECVIPRNGHQWSEVMSQRGIGISNPAKSILGSRFLIPIPPGSYRVGILRVKDVPGMGRILPEQLQVESMQQNLYIPPLGLACLMRSALTEEMIIGRMGLECIIVMHHPVGESESQDHKARLCISTEKTGMANVLCASFDRDFSRKEHKHFGLAYVVSSPMLP